MIDPLRPEQLVDRIRLAARQTSAGLSRVTPESIARGELPPVPEPLPPAPSSGRVSTEPVRPGTLEFPLEEAANMLPRARAKVTVGEGAPGFLRPLLRNQGGFNNILLEALERLVEVNRQLQRQNQELHGRLVSMQTWMNTAARTSGLDHDWMLAVENRLRSVSADRFSKLEERLARLEGMTTTEVDSPPAASEGNDPCTS